jgi:hypothetical protein
MSNRHNPSYAAVTTLINVECHYCGNVTQVNPNDPAQAGKLANILKVQRSDGSTFAFCDNECLRSGSRYFGRYPMVPVQTEQGIGFVQESGPEIIVTDQTDVRPVAVEEHQQIDLDRLKELAYEQNNVEGAD